MHHARARAKIMLVNMGINYFNWVILIPFACVQGVGESRIYKGRGAKSRY